MEVTSVLLSILTVLLSIVVYFVYYNLTYWKRRNISHSKPHLIYGNFKGVRSEYHEQDIYRSFYNKHKGNGPFAGFYFMIKPLVFVTDIKLARNILIKDFSSFTDRIAYYNEKDDPISAHLFSIDNPQWRELRTKLSPTFTSGKIKYMYPTVLRVCEQFVKIIGEKYSNNQSLDIKELYACFTTDVIGTCAFGIECNCLTNPEAEFRRVGRKFLDTLTVTNLKIGFATGFPKIARKLGITITPPDVSDFFLNTIRETVAYREEHNIKRNDFLDLLIEIKNNKEYGLTIEEIAAQAFIFFFGGFETSSSTSSFALYELARNQDIQNKLRNEINETLQRHNNQFSFECINDMIYLDQVINGNILYFYRIV